MSENPEPVDKDVDPEQYGKNEHVSPEEGTPEVGDEDQNRGQTHEDEGETA